jgi:hypothetical protein
MPGRTRRARLGTALCWIVAGTLPAPALWARLPCQFLFAWMT